MVIIIELFLMIKFYLILQDRSQCPFEDKWPCMRPIILKLLKQEPVTQAEWQDLFYSVYLVCMWDEKGAPKLRDALKEDIMDFIKQAQQVIIYIYLYYINYK